jgi:hypothetical protein
MSVKFEWDPKKAASNLSKHGVSFEEGLTYSGLEGPSEPGRARWHRRMRERRSKPWLN